MSRKLITGPERLAEPLDEKPLELILARNLISIISIAALLIDADNRIVFFNEAAAEIIGAPFEEIGVLGQEQWSARYGPFGIDGKPLPPADLLVTIAVRESRPAYGHYFVRAESGMLEIETGALPLSGPAGYHGAIVVFWPLPPTARS
jgi:PAS domain-containing protein